MAVGPETPSLRSLRCSWLRSLAPSPALGEPVTLKEVRHGRRTQAIPAPIYPVEVELVSQGIPHAVQKPTVPGPRQWRQCHWQQKDTKTLKAQEAIMWPWPNASSRDAVKCWLSWKMPLMENALHDSHIKCLPPEAAWVRELKTSLRALPTGEQERPPISNLWRHENQVERHRYFRSASRGTICRTPGRITVRFTVKNHTVPQKENDNSLETKLNAVECCIMECWELKIAVMKELSELQEHAGSSLSSE